MGWWPLDEFADLKTKKYIFYTLDRDNTREEIERAMERVEDYLTNSLAVNYAIENTPFSTRIWLDDEEAAVAFALFSGWLPLEREENGYSFYASDFIEQSRRDQRDIDC